MALTQRRYSSRFLSAPGRVYLINEPLRERLALNAFHIPKVVWESARPPLGSYAQKVLDGNDIVRDAILRQLRAIPPSSVCYYRS